MNTSAADQCCPPFNPEPWEEKELTWENRRFLKDRVTSFVHIPLNFGAVMKRSVALIEGADADTETRIVLSDENSLWGADVYIEVSKDIPGANVVSISGTFLSKVFEGPYSNIRKWSEEMKAHIESKAKRLKKMYFYYTTCPKCAEKYGKNYVVILAEV